MNKFSGKSFSFLGRSGSGKGTQFDLFQQELEKEGLKVIRHVSGAVFRSLSQSDTIAGNKIKEILETGGLMPDWLASFTWESRLIESLKSEEAIILFDGSPRRIEEARLLDDVLKWLGREALMPLYIDVSKEEVFARLKKRARNDDIDDAINARLEWFDKHVSPILDYYKEEGRLISVDGTGEKEDIFMRILKALN